MEFVLLELIQFQKIFHFDKFFDFAFFVILRDVNQIYLNLNMVL